MDNTVAVFVGLDAEGFLRLFALMRFSAVK